MILTDILFAMVVAVGLTLIFAKLLRNVGPWALWWMFLLLVFLAAWAGGVWITPVGPQLFGRYWLPFLLAGLFFALLLAAAAPVSPPRTEEAAQLVAQAEEATSTGVSIFFWILLLALIVAIVVAYIV